MMSPPTIDRDEKKALAFLKRVVYDQVSRSQQGRLKSHLDTGGDPVERFKQKPQHNCRCESR